MCVEFWMIFTIILHCAVPQVNLAVRQTDRLGQSNRIEFCYTFDKLAVGEPQSKHLASQHTGTIGQRKVLLLG